MQSYVNNVALVIANFQYIEEALRMHISTVNKRIKERMKDEIPFKYNYKLIAKDSLGILVGKFERINDNQSLVKELKLLVFHRNDIVHRALLLTVEEWNNKLQDAFRIAEVQKLRTRTRKILHQIIEETKEVEKINKK